MTNVGSKIKFNVSLELPSGLTMDNVDFSCAFYAYENKKAEIPKSEMTRIDAHNYTAVVDTEITGAGAIRLTVTTGIPDGSGIRTEIETIQTGVQIYERHKC